jgi:hypothetical protein
LDSFKVDFGSIDVLANRYNFLKKTAGKEFWQKEFKTCTPGNIGLGITELNL